MNKRALFPAGAAVLLLSGHAQAAVVIDTFDAPLQGPITVTVTNLDPNQSASSVSSLDAANIIGGYRKLEIQCRVEGGHWWQYRFSER